MKAKILSLLHINNFFRIVEQNGDNISCILEQPSRLLIQNIQSNWLRFLYNKTSKHMQVFNKNEYVPREENMALPIGYLNHQIPYYDSNKVFKYDISQGCPVDATELKLNIIVPKQDVMQYFIQWQRYRKFWWSSITTTPSLFSINDIKYGEDTAEVDIIAQYPWGTQPVETMQIQPGDKIARNSSYLSCKMSLEGSLLYILLDALTNPNKEEYLRLHRKMAPYKISFALNNEDINKKIILEELAKMLHLRLKIKRVSNRIPDWSLPLESQIKENLQLGVPYTAVLNEQTIENGIFYLLNSSTMLKEQVHIADFDDYAVLLCK